MLIGRCIRLKEGVRKSTMNHGASAFHDDPFGVIDCSRDEQALFLKSLRDRITCNEREKTLLFETGFTKERDFNGSAEENCMSLEILALLSTSRCQNTREGVRACIPQIFEFIKSQSLPPSSIHISMFRSFRIIISETDQASFYDKYLAFFLSVIEIEHQSLCLNAIKNEVIELLYRMLETDTRVKARLRSRRVIKILCNPDLHGIKLLNELIDEGVGKHVKIGRILKRVDDSNVKNKLEVLSCCVKLYRMSHSEDTRIMERILYELDELAQYRKESLVLIGFVVQDDVQAQLFCKDIELVSKIVDRFHETKPSELTPELLFCMYSLTAGLEENRKIAARSKMIPSVFGTFKTKVNRKQVDLDFVMIVLFLKSMTKSITFLRSGLLDYPIVELLIDALDNEFPDTIDGIDKMVPVENLGAGFIEKSILGVLVNLVMEYGDYKNKFIASNGVEKVLSYTFKFPHTVLQIFKNFLYDTSFNSKEVFIKATDRRFFKRFIDMYEENKDMEILEGCFNLMRNLLCDDTLDYIVQSYEDMIDSIFLYLDEFAGRTPISEGSKEEHVLLQILYTIVNLSANSDKFKSLVLTTRHLDNMKKVSTTRNLSIAFIWIIINLSWKEDGSEDRIQILCANGIREWLVKIQAKDSILADKIGTALENLRLA